MENKDLAVAQIVSAIISKEHVTVGADTESGVVVGIKRAHELKPDYRDYLRLDQLVELVRKSLI